MNESGNDKRIETLKQQLRDDLVDDEGNSPEAEEVETVIAQTRENLADAPIQDYVPLLVEHEARDELRRRGNYHREFDEDEATGVQSRPADDDAEEHRRRLDWNATPHL